MEEIIRVRYEYYIHAASALADDRSRVIKQDPTDFGINILHRDQEIEVMVVN